jgi:hypothetical protein
MKTLLLLCSLLAASQALAAGSDHDMRPRGEDRGASANVGAPPRLHRSGGECGVDRASPVFAQSGGLLGYECSSSANGS